MVIRAEPTAMSFNNGLGDGQAHTHAGVFGRKEAVKKIRKMCWLNAWAAILDAAANRIDV